MLHITTAAEEHLPTCVLGPCGRGDEGGTSYGRGWGWGRLLGMLLQLIEVISVDNIHLEQLLLLAARQSLHNILLGGHLHPRLESVYTVSSSAERGIMCEKILGPDTLNVDMGDFV